MTDHPRLQAVPTTPDRAYLSYHGAPLVDLTFRLLDWWLSRTSQSCVAACASAPNQFLDQPIHRSWRIRPDAPQR